MNEDLDALLRDHYRAAADEIHADADTVRRFQDAGRAAAPARTSVLRRWTFPALAAAVTAAVLVAAAVLFWPDAHRPEPPRPMAPPATPAPTPTAEPSVQPSVQPSVPPTATPSPSAADRSLRRPVPRHAVAPTATPAPSTATAGPGGPG
ncbi:hypothetical protein [Actinomadura bangladeshensis]|uniref:Uncharacterized protein n=1 Tax=Actinomadura bangladeshensis TaxID=453573 RepID=A0A4R4NKH0_9ACTN|nr:hypothetical protein [Actinomadura bangladeshensis]TDC07422.1 hypothetical protein E1284_32450 [Actinomadura bangladeshensis]